VVPFDFSLSLATSGSVAAGHSVSFPVTVGLISGTTQSVSLSLSGAPSGTTVKFSASSCNPDCDSKLTLETSESTPAGSYTITVTGSSGQISHTASLTLTVTAGPVRFDFSLSVASGGSVTAGQSVSFPVTVSLISGRARRVSLSVSGVPSGVEADFSTSACRPNCSSTLTLETSESTPAGSYTITVKGTSESLNHTVSLKLDVTAPTPDPTNSITSGLVGYWPFDEGTGLMTYDSSGNSNNGILINKPIWTTGKVGQALKFNVFANASNDDVRQNAASVLIGKSFDVPDLPLTLTAWINPVDFNDWRAIFSKRDSYDYWDMRFDIGLSMDSGAVYLTTAQDTVTFDYTPPTNAWTHIAVVATRTNTRLYVNGQLVEESDPVRLGTSERANTAIGGTGEGVGGDNDPFSGIIDEVRIYNRALSASEVQQVYAYAKQ
jgi:Concanavalin A-like lectin/glucanases superfamily